QEAFETAQRHLKSYRGKVSALSGQEQLELETTASVSINKPLPLLDETKLDDARTEEAGIDETRIEAKVDKASA
ncbi:MAG: hypothetical protein WB566_01530, partial [Terriglobales bacterium]